MRPSTIGFYLFLRLSFYPNVKVKVSLKSFWWRRLSSLVRVTMIDRLPFLLETFIATNVENFLIPVWETCGSLFFSTETFPPLFPWEFRLSGYCDAFTAVENKLLPLWDFRRVAFSKKQKQVRFDFFFFLNKGASLLPERKPRVNLEEKKEVINHAWECFIACFRSP